MQLVDTVSATTINGGPAGDDRLDRMSGCFVCGGEFRHSRLPGLRQCERCGFVSAEISISDAELQSLYGEDYFHGQEYFDYLAEEDSLRLNFSKRLPELRRLLPGWSTADVFEIGCAYGFFLEEIRGEVGHASGIDISADAIRYAAHMRGLDATQGDYLSVDLGRQVDAIAMWDTIEHLRRPDLFVAKAASDLRPGGILAITTGDIGSFNARLRSKNWRMIHPPTHMHYFSVPTLSKLLDRHGFDVVHVSHPGNSRQLRSMLYIILAMKMRRRKLYDLLRDWPLLDRALTINLFDIMFVVGRRRQASKP